VDDILTPSLVSVAFAWVVVLDYEQALGCADLGDGEEGTILVVTHDYTPCIGWVCDLSLSQFMGASA